MSDQCTMDEIDYDDPRFNQGVQHVVNMLSDVVGTKDWVAGDGSEDYDDDLWQTLLNILAARGLYDKDTGQYAADEVTLLRNQLVTAKKAARELERCCEVLAATRSQATYDSMICDGQADHLLALDQARSTVRALSDEQRGSE